MKRTDSEDSAPYMDVRQAAVYLCVTPWFIAERIRHGELPAKKLGNKYVVSRKSLDEFFSNAEDAA